MTPQRQTGRFSDQQRKRYAELLRVSDPDALHDLLLRHGPGILDRDLPYLVVAARNQKRSTLRRGAAQHEVPSPDIHDDRESSLWDPLARVVANEELGQLLTALGDLDPRDVLVLWSNAAGRSDAEIASQWDDLQFDPPNPSAESIRKRRQRARARLKKNLDL